MEASASCPPCECTAYVFGHVLMVSAEQEGVRCRYPPTGRQQTPGWRGRGSCGGEKEESGSLNLKRRVVTRGSKQSVSCFVLRPTSASLTLRHVGIRDGNSTINPDPDRGLQVDYSVMRSARIPGAPRCEGTTAVRKD